MGDMIFIKHDSGTRFTATAKGYTVVTGEGDGDKGEDGMTPGLLFVSSLGMCVGGTLVTYCKNHEIPYEGMEIELVRENTKDGKRLKTANLQVRIPSKLSEKDIKVLNRVAHRCYIHQSIESGIDLDISISEKGDVVD
jgi:uncharacterized OsmC-like protein